MGKNENIKRRGSHMAERGKYQWGDVKKKKEKEIRRKRIKTR